MYYIINICIVSLIGYLRKPDDAHDFTDASTNTVTATKGGSGHAAEGTNILHWKDPLPYEEFTPAIYENLPDGLS